MDEELIEKIENLKNAITTEKIAQLSDEDLERITGLLDELEQIMGEN